MMTMTRDDRHRISLIDRARFGTHPARVYESSNTNNTDNQPIHQLDDTANTEYKRHIYTPCNKILINRTELNVNERVVQLALALRSNPKTVVLVASNWQLVSTVVRHIISMMGVMAEERG
jgi:hypothetical protein